MAVILFYTPFSRRARDVESLMLAFHALGHKVISLDQVEGREFSAALKGGDIEVHEHVLSGTGLWFHVRHVIDLVKFCRSRRVSVVFSHLDGPNFVASIAQFFIRARVYLCRHHIDEAALYNFHRSWTYRLTNWLARHVIVVSERARDYVVATERVAPGKVIHINLAYDFSLFTLPSTAEIQAIRSRYPAKVLLVTVCRLTKFKRPDESLKALNLLRARGVDATLLILGEGDMRKELELQIVDLKLQGSAFLPGHVGNPLHYLAAADFVLHPSLLESSCVTVKEAGLLKKPVIVCEGIGDFDSFMDDGVNGFIVAPDRFACDAASIVEGAGAEKTATIGENLFKDVHRIFGIDQAISKYLEIINEKAG